jgi:hypothetical protein
VFSIGCEDDSFWRELRVLYVIQYLKDKLSKLKSKVLLHKMDQK